VGKTELAKAVARFYSSSKRPQTYPMGNFTEHHSVSGIIGPPPGYHGHDAGGRLINDLLADPHGVFLLDEGEKAHAEVWRPFLNLFDEGWITDRRGVRAFGDRAIFIITTNAGHETIARMTAEAGSAAEIAEAVRGDLLALRDPRSHEKVFPPEFLGRLQQIVVFRPLDSGALEGITRLMVDERRRHWRERLGKEVLIPEELVEYIAELSHEANERAKQTEGARVVRRMIAGLVEDPLTRAMDRDRDAFESCTRIELDYPAPSDPPVAVRFQSEGEGP
ncbi:MAG: AAA family ATPase, partial [Spirillospora sp.]